MRMKDYLFFMGCTIPARARNYEISGRRVAKEFGINLIDEPNFCCCGFPIKNADYSACLLMAARNLAIAEAKKTDICTFCSACTGVLTEVNNHLKEHEELRRDTNKKLAQIDPKLKFEGTINVKHLARILYEEVGPDQIKSLVKKPLSGLQVAVHYGCHYLKPSESLHFEDPEAPVSLDRIVEATGATSANYLDKKFCCGGALLAFDQNTALSVGNHKLAILKNQKVDTMVLICPFCSVMYDDNQRSIETKFSTTYGLPILYLPQLLGLALGIPSKDLGFPMNKVKTQPVLAKLGAQ